MGHPFQLGTDHRRDLIQITQEFAEDVVKRGETPFQAVLDFLPRADVYELCMKAGPSGSDIACVAKKTLEAFGDVADRDPPLFTERAERLSAQLSLYLEKTKVDAEEFCTLIKACRRRKVPDHSDVL
ncbi:hypothetical protein AAVH_05971 [Aphelenchoides avenae]|nr:hypothetical protein AAVH_05971 [Aphelenchus avenae]